MSYDEENNLVSTSLCFNLFSIRERKIFDRKCRWDKVYGKIFRNNVYFLTIEKRSISTLRMFGIYPIFFRIIFTNIVSVAKSHVSEFITRFRYISERVTVLLFSITETRV